MNDLGAKRHIHSGFGKKAQNGAAGTMLRMTSEGCFFENQQRRVGDGRGFTRWE